MPKCSEVKNEASAGSGLTLQLFLGTLPRFSDVSCLGLTTCHEQYGIATAREGAELVKACLLHELKGFAFTLGDEGE